MRLSCGRGRTLWHEGASSAMRASCGIRASCGMRLGQASHHLPTCMAVHPPLKYPHPSFMACKYPSPCVAVRDISPFPLHEPGCVPSLHIASHHITALRMSWAAASPQAGVSPPCHLRVTILSPPYHLPSTSLTPPCMSRSAAHYHVPAIFLSPPYHLPFHEPCYPPPPASHHIFTLLMSRAAPWSCGCT